MTTALLISVLAGTLCVSPEVGVRANDGIEQARALLAEGAFDVAAARARAALLADPSDGHWQLLLGLAEFRAGRYESALAAFEAARKSAAPPPVGNLWFNIGAALFSLERFDESEKAFLQAGRADPSLGDLATLNAAECMLAAGHVDRARRYWQAIKPSPELAATAADLGQRIDAADSEQQLTQRQRLRQEAKAALLKNQGALAAAHYQQLLDDAQQRKADADELGELEYALGLALYRQGDFDAAARAFQRATAYLPNDAEAVAYWGLSLRRSGAWTSARVALRRALALGLPPSSEDAVRATLDELSFGLRGLAPGWQLSLSAGTGYDSNVWQGAPSHPEVMTADQVGQAGGFFLHLGAQLGYGAALGRSGYWGADYILDQLAYPDSTHDAYSVQDHSLRVRAEWSPWFDFHLGIVGQEELQFDGLRQFAPFQLITTAEPTARFDESAHTATNAGLRLQSKRALSDDDSYLSGRRLDLRLGQQFRWPHLRAELAYRRRYEDIGTRTQPLVLSDVGNMVAPRYQKRVGTLAADAAEFDYAAPYSYRSNAWSFSQQLSFARWRLAIDGSVERLDYVGENQVFLVVPSMNIDRLSERQHRVDLRWAAGVTLGWAPSAAWEVLLRYDYLRNGSTIRLDVDDRRFTKHTLMLEASWDY